MSQFGPLYQHQTNPESVGAAADPGGSMRAKDASVSNSGTFVVGRILSYISGMNAYRVDCHHRPKSWATDLSTGLSAMGARAFNCYAPNQSVLLWWPYDGCEWGYIVAGLHTDDTEDWKVQGISLFDGSGVGFEFDRVHRALTHVDDDADADFPRAIHDFNSGRPWDTLSGDHGWINEFGTYIALLKTQAVMRAGFAELGVSSIDAEARIAGERITVESLTTELRHFNDQGEGSTIAAMTPYLWEGLGQSKPRFASSQHVARADMKLDAEQLAIDAPENWDQAAIFRYLRLEGFLGGLLHDWVIWPRLKQVSEGQAATVRRSEIRTWPGLAETHTDIDGFITIRTAKGFLLQKTSMIPVPEEHKEPWDPSGDKDADCDWGKAAYAADRTDYAWPDPDPTSRVSHLVDFYAWRTQIANMLGVNDHTKDWKVPNDTDVDLTLIGTPEPKTASDDGKPLGRKFTADMPKTVTIDVDHRRPKVKYRAGIASIFLGDDGSIALTDAYGSSFFSGGGNQELAPRGDLILRPGRRLVAMAPLDIVMMAGRNAELSASKGDLWLKAQQNMSLLSGVEGKGFMLLENRGSDPTGVTIDLTKQGQNAKGAGIIIKAQDAPVVAYGGTMTLQARNGQFVIDAGKGTQDLHLVAGTIRLTAEESVVQAVGFSMSSGATDPTQLSMLTLKPDGWSSAVGGVRTRQGGGQFQILGNAGSTASLLVEGDVRAKGELQSPNTKVQPFDADKIRPSFSQLQQLQRQDQTNAGFGAAALRVLYYEPSTGLLNDTWVDRLKFSFNASTDYWTDQGFTLYATPWQIRYASASAPKWEQPSVRWYGGESRPWPGHEAWTAKDSFGAVDAAKFKNATPAGLPLNMPRDDAVPEVQTKTTLEGGYVIDSQG